MTAATITTYQLRAVTDDSIGKIHLGAVEKGNVTFCGVRLLVQDDPRFGGRYKDIVYTASADLTAVTCGACKRSAAWKGAKDGTYTVPGTRPRAAASTPAAAGPQAPTTRKRPSAATRAAARNAAQAKAQEVSGSSVIEPDSKTGLPRIRPDVQAKADQVVADQLAKNAEAGR